MKKEDRQNVIIFGIGNAGRQDDGIGWLFLGFLQNQNENINLEYRYQLQIEDAELISHYNRVIFVDATKKDTEEGFCLEVCHPSEKYSFSTHALAPETILYLSNHLYHHNPEAFIFGIQGYEWELKIGLSDKATKNLDKATKYFKDTILIDYL
ncbi:hydrogenase maturation protease [Yeosuana sp.]|uniref:hydrogenase maturation protease n=1 Tax=Yeosuana sp. TaxID=2529388 RepID=UPI004055189D|tara:strand:- start:3541 stop:3999 length:459 start_codon:yes stop_codon:yes gene_type:complete